MSGGVQITIGALRHLISFPSLLMPVLSEFRFPGMNNFQMQILSLLHVASREYILNVAINSIHKSRWHRIGLVLILAVMPIFLIKKLTCKVEE